jgi:hypothetical protein
MSIVTFGKRERVRFQAEGSLDQWRPVGVPSVYAITYKQDALARPKAHTVLFFGECENPAVEAPNINKDFETWCDKYANHSELFVFTHQMPGSSKFERARVTHALVLEYDPQAND